jgi:squalene-hopene/tetraprenyl-beta-curcumene cyclase
MFCSNIFWTASSRSLKRRSASICALNISASVKAYFALKMLGDDPDAPHMARARAAILAAGGAERTNVFTRAQLALFGEVPWRAVPVMPVELVLLPKWFPFHLDKISYWSRTVIVPLTVLMARKPRARNPRGVHVAELFRTPPEHVRDWIRGPYRSNWGNRRFRQHCGGGRRHGRCGSSPNG